MLGKIQMFHWFRTKGMAAHESFELTCSSWDFVVPGERDTTSRYIAINWIL